MATSHSEKKESDPALRVRALESILAEKGLIDPKALDALVDTYENKIGPRTGAGGAPKTYYQQWLTAAENIMVAKGVTSPDQLAARKFSMSIAGSAHQLR